jgi:hypothetical protein
MGLVVGLRDAVTEWRAHRFLSTLADRFGSDGLTVAASVPGLAASVDQHAAAVRDILEHGVDGADALTTRVLLAGYGRGLLDRAALTPEEVGSRAARAGWTRADWLALRLLAVCALGRRDPAVRSAR